MAQPEPVEELFRPTVAASVRDGSLPKPWRMGSQLFVAFFGGPFAVLAIAWMNTHRLGMDWRALGPRMLSITLVIWGVVATAAVAVALTTEVTDQLRPVLRWSQRGGALVVYAFLARIQKPGDRRWSAQHGDDYASLWGPGLIAVVAGNVAQIVVTIALAAVLSNVLGDEG